MIIHYLANSEFPANSANAVHVWSMCTAFAANGDHCHLFARRTSAASLCAPGCDCTLIANRGSNRAITPFRLFSASLSAPRPDLYFGRHLPTLILASLRGIPTIYECHAMTRGMAALLERILLSRPNLVRVVLISEQLRLDFIQRYPHIRKDRVLVLHDAAAPPDERAAPRANWPGRANHPQVGYVGSLFRGKGAEIVVALAASMPDVDFHIIGGRPQDVAELARTSTTRNLFLHGHVPHEELTGCYRHLDIALLPLQQRCLDGNGQDIARWTSPLKLFEYMAHGLAVVASDLPVLREVLTDKDSALLVPPRDLARWRQAINILIADSNLRQALSASAKRLFETRYTWQRRARLAIEGLPR